MTTVEELAAQVTALQRRVDGCESLLQLQALKARYGELVDQRFASGRVVDDPALEKIAHDAASLFTVDGTWDGGPRLGIATGRAAIASRLRQPTLSFSLHLFVKPRIEVDGDGPRDAGICSVRAVLPTVRPIGCADTRTTPMIRDGGRLAPPVDEAHHPVHVARRQGWDKILA